jgi:flavorubredoxin
MSQLDDSKLDYENPVEIASGIYWVGFYDQQSGLHCNPYLVIDNDEALVIDGGSRPDFATVMMKILQTGMDPDQIKALLYQHYDPDLCGSIPNFEDIIESKSLKIISDESSLDFIRHYSVSSVMVSIEDIDYHYTFSSGRTLRFINTPYSHSSGSFVTFDQKSGILFTSDIFGSYGKEWDLYLKLRPQCMDCVNLEECPEGRRVCPVNDILNFHRIIMPSRKALRYSLARILEVPFTAVAPQHGSIINDKNTLRFVFERLVSLKAIGIDGIIEDEDSLDFSNLSKRFQPDEN